MQRMSSPYLKQRFSDLGLPVFTAQPPASPAGPLCHVHHLSLTPKHPVALPEIQVGLTEAAHNCSGYKLRWVTVLRMVLLLRARVYKTSELRSGIKRATSSFLPAWYQQLIASQQVLVHFVTCAQQQVGPRIFKDSERGSSLFVKWNYEKLPSGLGTCP